MRKYKQEPYTVPPWIYNAIQVLRPVERLTVSEWAAKYRVLPDGNAIPGPWSNSVTPYLVEIMDAFSDDMVEEIVFVKPTQVGGTSAMENMLGSLIAQDPAPAMVVYPSDDLAERTTESKLEPMVRSCKVLAGNVKKCAVGKHPKSEKHGNTAQFSEVERSGTQENCGGIESGCLLRLHPLPVPRRRQPKRVACIDPDAVVVDKNIAKNDRFDLFSR